MTVNTSDENEILMGIRKLEIETEIEKLQIRVCSLESALQRCNGQIDRKSAELEKLRKALGK